jgi:uncharacterized membrane protein/Mg-chelatase subunit ChlD
MQGLSFPGIRVVLLAVVVSVASCSQEAVRPKQGKASDQETDRCVIFLLDVSQTVPKELLNSMVGHINRGIAAHRQETDRAGVIVFGRKPHWEIQITSDDVELGPSIESPVDPSATDLAAAIRLAANSFPTDCQKRMVIITDGNQTHSDALREAKSAAAAGIGIDVVPIRYHYRRDVAVERLSLPGRVRRGLPFDLSLVINNVVQPTGDDSGDGSGEVPGRLVVSKSICGQQVVVSDEPVTLPPGKSVLSFRQQVDAPGLYTYEAQFIADEPEGTPQNNRASAFARVDGRDDQVLLIEDYEHRGEFDRLIDELRRLSIDVTVQQSNQLFANLAELQAYDTVIMAGVPRERFTDAQLKALACNTQHLGCGLIMLGGPNGLGAGGWANTELEAIMPLDFQVRTAKVKPPGALVVMLDGALTGRPGAWQQVIAGEALRTLGDTDYLGLLYYDGLGKWAWGHPNSLLRIGPARAKMLKRIAETAPGRAPDLDPLLRMARHSLNGVPSASVKHMLLISDGRPSPPAASTLQMLSESRITVSTVAVSGQGPADSTVLKRIADATGGKYYQVRNNKALTRVAQREARRVCRPLIYEKPGGWRPLIKSQHEILSGIDEPLPPILGYELTSVKEDPLVEVLLEVPSSAGTLNKALLATWKSGHGRAAVFTSDAGARWLSPWTTWEGYGRFFGQMVRWSMRQTSDSEGLVIETHVEDGTLQVTAHKLDLEAEAPSVATVVLPTLDVDSVQLEQTGTDEFSGSYEVREGGVYCICLDPANSRTRIESVCSPEFRARKTNDELLEALAGLKPEGGRPGKIIESTAWESNAPLEVNPFRNVGASD